MIAKDLADPQNNKSLTSAVQPNARRRKKETLNDNLRMQLFSTGKWRCNHLPPVHHQKVIPSGHVHTSLGAYMYCTYILVR